MIYKKYGETFRRIRKQKKIPLSHFERLGISKAALGKFERGEAMMGFDRVMLALQTLDISLEEYEHFLNNFLIGDREALIEEIYEAYILGNQPLLLQLSEKTAQLNYPILSLTAKSCTTLLNNKEKQEIIDYLQETEDWGYIELCVFYHAIYHLMAEDISYLMNNFLLEGHNLFRVPKYRDKFIRVAYCAISRLAHKGHEALANYTLTRFDRYNLPHTMFNQNLRNFTTGYLKYRFNHPEKGKEQMLQSLTVTKLLNKPEISAYYDRIYDILMN